MRSAHWTGSALLVALLLASCSAQDGPTRGRPTCEPRCQGSFRLCTREGSGLCVDELRSCLESCASGDTCDESCTHVRTRCRSRGGEVAQCDRGYRRCIESCRIPGPGEAGEG